MELCKTLRAAAEITRIAIMTALLIAVQFVCSFVSGVELVTAVLLSYSYCVGIKRGVAVSVSFSVLRCLIFGFFPSVIILYLVYYPLFALFVGALGHLFNRKLSAGTAAAMTAAGCALTSLFTLFDDVVTPFLYGYAPEGAEAYFFASLPVMGIQIVCAAATVAVLFLPLSALMKKIMV